jgi:hypothetical protein
MGESMSLEPMGGGEGHSCDRCGQNVGHPANMPDHVARSHMDSNYNRIIGSLSGGGKHEAPPTGSRARGATTSPYHGKHRSEDD